ncbi:MAG: BON domain-containing protein [Pseudomonadota bacterium]|jgi:hyperosmotically inducible periplasmic protein
MHNNALETSIRRRRHGLRATLGPAALVMALAASPASFGQTRFAETVGDSALTAEIKTRLMADADTRGININVDSDQGMVTLRGTVPSEAAKQKAAEIALSVAGTSSVANALVVGDSSSNPQTLTARTKQAGEAAGEAISDGWITAQVKARLLADEDTDGMTIEVSTADGEVTLAGLVPSRAVRDEAILIAHRVQGVQSVNATALQVRQTP